MKTDKTPKRQSDRLRVFLCYASQDYRTVKSLYDRLERDGFDPWMDRISLRAGSLYPLAILREIPKSDAFLFCLSRFSITKGGYLEWELNLGLDLATKKAKTTAFFIPVLLEEGAVFEELEFIQSINFYEDSGYEQLRGVLPDIEKELARIRRPRRPHVLKRKPSALIEPATRNPPRHGLSVKALPSVAHYILRDDDKEALDALRGMPFTMLVSGPLQCGKSSLLAKLGCNARDAGIETAWYDPALERIAHGLTGRPDLSTNSRAAMTLSERLQAEWNLGPPARLIDSISELFIWLKQELSRSVAKPRLLILDDLANVGIGAVDEWLTFVRVIHNNRSLIDLSLAIGLTRHFQAPFGHELLNLSSNVHWWPKIELAWFDRKQVAQLEKSINNGSSPAGDLYELFSGQPFLTHAAATSSSFRQAVQRWTSDRSAINSRTVREALPFTKHLDSIKLAFCGPELA